MRFVIGITGASGIQYGIRLVETLAQARHQVYLLVTDAARLVIREELGMAVPGSKVLDLWQRPIREWIEWVPLGDLGHALASGSFVIDGMAVAPCSVKTLSAIATASAATLLERAADVTLKERRKLVLVPRETPLHSIHLELMHKLSLAGAVILPAMPGFYHQPKSVDDLVDFIVARILDQLGVAHQLVPRWEKHTKEPMHER